MIEEKRADQTKLQKSQNNNNHLLQLQRNDRRQLLHFQRIEIDEFIDAIEELRAEFLLEGIHGD